MKKFLMALGFVVLAGGIAFAAVVIQNDGTRVGATDKINIVGGAPTQLGSVITVSTLLSAQDVDTALYTKVKPSGFGKTLCINIDGTIYPNSGACS